MIVTSVLSLLGIGASSAVVLAVASRLLKVEENPNIELVTEALPGANCGGCGFPGCEGFAAAVEDAIRYMFNADSIMVSGRSVPQGRVRNILRQLTIDHIDHVQLRLADTTEAITNSTSYLVSCIYNSVADEAVARIQSGY